MSLLNKTQIRRVYELINLHDRKYPCIPCKNRQLNKEGKIDCLCEALYEFYATLLKELTQ